MDIADDSTEFGQAAALQRSARICVCEKEWVTRAGDVQRLHILTLLEPVTIRYRVKCASDEKCNTGRSRWNLR